MTAFFAGFNGLTSQMIDPEFRDLADQLTALQPRFRRFAYGLTGSMDEADDLVQNAYERAFNRLHQWKPGTRLDSWMFRIIQTVHLNGIDSQRVRQRYASDTDPDDVATRKQNSPEANLQFDEVRKLVAQLPEDQRVVLLLVAVEGVSYKEAAEVLRVPIGTVTSRIARARATLVSGLDERPKPKLVTDNSSSSQRKSS